MRTNSNLFLEYFDVKELFKGISIASAWNHE